MKLLHSQCDRTKCLISNIITMVLQMLQCQKILFHKNIYFLHHDLMLGNIKMYARRMCNFFR